MARRKHIIQKDTKKEYEFVPPQFDEKEFITKDIYETKVLAVIAVISVITGLLCSYIQKNSPPMFGPTLSLALFCLITRSLRNIMATLRFNVQAIENKSWLGNYIMFMFLGMGIWILMINAPFI
ncbi:MAG: hypothetical protein MJY54_02460 [archaeon]|nr:hypothetical protein [archaeon]